MGRIYRAQHLDLDRLVAIKVLNQVFHPGQITDEDRKRRFLREAKAASSLDHPNIVTIYDLVRDAGREFLIMEYVEGPSLAAMLEKGPLLRQKAYRFARQIAGALAAAHRVGVIHRDTKPSNVVIAGGDIG